MPLRRCLAHCGPVAGIGRRSHEPRSREHRPGRVCRGGRRLVAERAQQRWPGANVAGIGHNIRMTDWATLVPAVATILAAGIGAYLSGRYGQRSTEAEFRRSRRHVLADTSIEAARVLRAALHNSEPGWTGRDWERVLGDVYDALNAAAPVLPDRMRHLRRSIRDACGEALGGVARFGRAQIHEHPEPAAFDPVWSENARDYLDVAIGSIRRWKESKERDASTVRAPTYDEWLRSQGRYPAAS